MSTEKKLGSGKSLCDGKDEEFSKGFYQICCLNNKGPSLPGHFLKIEDKQVTANASKDDRKSKLKIRAVQNDKEELIMIIGNQHNEALAVEHDQTEDKYAITVGENEQLGEIHKLREAEEYTSNYLFKKVPLEPGSEIFQITSNILIGGKPLVLAFDEDGETMDPMNNPPDDRSYFRLFSA